LFLWSQRSAEMFRIEEANTPFEPNVEEIA
jgi:hypothetical protein